MIKLVSKNVDIKIYPEDPNYAMLSNMLGQTFRVEAEGYSLMVDEEELFSGKIHFDNNVETGRVTGQVDFEENTEEVKSYDTEDFSTESLKSDMENSFTEDFLQNTSVGQILNSHFSSIDSAMDTTTLELRYESDGFTVYGKDNSYWVL
jgi:hypothetical protein